jgi:gliding motility-associated-like protein
MKNLLLCLAILTLSINTHAQCTLNYSFFPNDTVCTGQGTTISITNPGISGTVNWSGPTLTSPISGTQLNINANSSQFYIVNWNDGICNVTDTVNLVVVPVKAILISQSNPSCGRTNGNIIGAANGVSPLFTWLKDGVFFTNGNTQLTNVPAGNYTFAVYDDVTGCSDTIKNIDLVDNTTFPFFSSIQTTGVQCFGDLNGNIQITMGGGTGNYAYAWSQDQTNNTSSAQNLTSGTPYTITVNDGGCPAVDTTITLPGPTDSVTISLRTHPDNCKQSKGTAKAIALGGTAPYQYSWSLPNGQGDSISGILGPNRISVTVTDNNGCFSVKSDTIENTGSPSFSIIAIDSSCTGSNQGKIALQPLSNDGPFNYVWSHNSTINDSFATALAPGNYTVSAYNSLNCPEIINFDIPAYTGGFFTLGDDQRITVGQNALIQLYTDAAYYDVKWTPNNTLSANNNNDLFAFPNQTTTYTFTITYGAGCTLTDDIAVYVDSLKDSIDIPTIFTPNGDGINDYFYIKTQNIERLGIRIYNKWGERVFQGFDMDFRWDGRNPKGESLSDGNYAYVITYKSYDSEQEKSISGFISLIN